MKYYKLILILLYLSGHQVAKSQEPDTLLSDFGGLIYLDSIVVKATKSGFKIDDFIDLVLNDESFYTAFRNLRFVGYTSDYGIKLFDKKAKEKAEYRSKTQQLSEGNCRTMRMLEEESSGNFYKRKRKYRYYTAKMFDHLFYTHGKVCEARKEAPDAKNMKGMKKHVSELKKLIFSPGAEADVPLIGGKTAIFNPKMAKYYDYKIRAGNYKSGEACYIFQAIIKDKYLNHKTGKTIIKNLETYFSKENFQIVAREYHLKYATAVYDFNVRIQIELTRQNDQYLPEYIYYNGNWDIPMKKRETAEFSIHFYDFF